MNVLGVSLASQTSIGTGGSAESGPDRSATAAFAIGHIEDSIQPFAKVRVGGLLVDNATMKEAVAFAIERARHRRYGSPALLATVNARSTLLAADSLRFTEILNHSALSIADGMSIVVASRLLGTPLQERVAGVDLVEELCKQCAREKLSVYFLGGRPGAADRTAAILQKRYPGLLLAGTDCPPNDFRDDPFENERVLRRIREAAPDLLFVAFGMPKQEYWITENASTLTVGIAMPVGGTFELIAGLVPRAPRWLQQIGMEWLFRLMMEPRRLWRRYLIGNARFIGLFARQYLETTPTSPETERITITSLERE